MASVCGDVRMRQPTTVYPPSQRRTGRAKWAPTSYLLELVAGTSSSCRSYSPRFGRCFWLELCFDVPQLPGELGWSSAQPQITLAHAHLWPCPHRVRSKLVTFSGLFFFPDAGRKVLMPAPITSNLSSFMPGLPGPLGTWGPHLAILQGLGVVPFLVPPLSPSFPSP